MAPPYGPRLFHLLSLAARRAQIVADEGLRDLEVSQAQVGVLFAVPADGATTISDIASALRLAQSGASTLAQRMEKAGLLSREADEADARITVVRLTPRGRAVRAEAVARVKALNRRMSERFTPHEIDIVARWLEHVALLEGR